MYMKLVVQHPFHTCNMYYQMHMLVSTAFLRLVTWLWSVRARWWGGRQGWGAGGGSLQQPSHAQPMANVIANVGLLVQEVLQRLRQRRMSCLSHRQHEIEGILQCSEPEEGMSDSADELDNPAGHQPATGPETHHADQTEQADMEDMGALAHDLQDAATEEEQQHRQQAVGESHHLSISNPACPGLCQSPPTILCQLSVLFRLSVSVIHFLNLHIPLCESRCTHVLPFVYRLF